MHEGRCSDTCKGCLLEQAARWLCELFLPRDANRPNPGSAGAPTSCGDIATNGTVPNTDFVIYVTAVPAASSDPNAVTLAWAFSCAANTIGRSIAAQVNIAPSQFFASSSAQYDLDRHTITHELSHALGFSDPWFPDGKYLSLSGDGRIKGGVTTALNAALGKKVTKLTSPRVLSKARTYFNCSSLDGVEIEDQGGDGTAGSHWEKRILGEEMMNGLVTTPRVYASSITLAFFEDLGYFKINYSAAEDAGMQWGRNTNCDINNNKCNAALPGTAKTFCVNNPRARNVCSAGRIAIGDCGLTNYSTIPVNFRYFPNQPKTGGLDIADYCPVIEAGYSTVCIDDTNSNDTVLANNYGLGSRCFQSTVRMNNGGISFGPNTGSARCHFFSCGADGRLTILVNNAKVQCPADGSAANVTVAGFSGVLTCPPSLELCGTMQPMAPTSRPATQKPPTAKPPTAKPPTAKPPTAKPPTAKPPTAKPPTAKPPTAKPSSMKPSTMKPTPKPQYNEYTVTPTKKPPTAKPSSMKPSTMKPTPKPQYNEYTVTPTNEI